MAPKISMRLCFAQKVRLPRHKRPLHYRERSDRMPDSSCTDFALYCPNLSVASGRFARGTVMVACDVATLPLCKAQSHRNFRCHNHKSTDSAALRLRYPVMPAAISVAVSCDESTVESSLKGMMSGVPSNKPCFSNNTGR